MTQELPSRLIDRRIEELKDAGDWRGEALARIRALIRQAEPDVVEEVKWRKPSNPLGAAVWSSPAPSRGGARTSIICTGETYRDKVKLTFARGASLDDPDRLFNASLQAGVRRAIDLHEGDRINEPAFKALIRAAAALNASS